VKLRIEPDISDFSTVPPCWIAIVESDTGTPLYDASGPTIELALAGVIKELCQELEDRS
jgi:hypothetical protein